MATSQPTAGSGSAERAGRLRIAISRLSNGLRTHNANRDLTPTRLSTLSIVESSGPIRVGDLAAMVGIAAPTVSRLIECLHRQELITRSPDPDDLRATRLTLSGTGRSVLAELRRRNTGFLADRMQQLGPEQLAVLDAALPVLERLAGNDIPAARNRGESGARAVRESQQEQQS